MARADRSTDPAQHPDAGAGTAPEATVRRLIHESATASLATRLMDDTGADAGPYASLVAVAPAATGAPLLLLSDLAQHTRNLAAEPRACLLFDGTGAADTPLAGARASVLGRIVPVDDPALSARYLRWQPEAEGYAKLGDFRLYRMEVARAHLVAGFGRIRWVAGETLLRNIDDAEALMAREADIVGHMNDDHLDAIAEVAHGLLGRGGSGWVMAGVDPEGADLACGRWRARLAFARRVTDAEGCRAELVKATKRARQRSAN
jgi:hypothetical protein